MYRSWACSYSYWQVMNSIALFCPDNTSSLQASTTSGCNLSNTSQTDFLFSPHFRTRHHFLCRTLPLVFLLVSSTLSSYHFGQYILTVHYVNIFTTSSASSGHLTLAWSLYQHPQWPPVPMSTFPYVFNTIKCNV